MKIAFVRRGWPVRAIVMMFFIYCCAHGLMAWVSIESGWWELRRLYRSPDEAIEEKNRLPGELKLRNVRFDVNTASAYSNNNIIHIRGPKVLPLFSSFYFPDLQLPADKLLLAENGRGYWVDCNEGAKIYFEMVP